MIKLLIDGNELELDQDVSLGISFALADIEDPNSSTTGYSNTFEVPFTSQNLKVMQFTNETFSREQFNNELHTAELYKDEQVVMTGTAVIEKYELYHSSPKHTSDGYFNISIVGASFQWVSQLDKELYELESEDGLIYNIANVYANSIDTQPSLVKFFPVDRGAFYTLNTEYEEDFYEARTELVLKDYHPFINVWETLQLIMSGYEVITSLEDEFLKLYFSGTPKNQDNSSYLEEENDFLAGSTLNDYLYTFNTSQALLVFDDWGQLDSGEDYFVATDGILVRKNAMYTYFYPSVDCTAYFDIVLNYTTTVNENLDFVNRFLFGSTTSLEVQISDCAEWQDEVSYSYTALELNKDYIIALEFARGYSYLSVVVAADWEPWDLGYTNTTYSDPYTFNIKDGYYTTKISVPDDASLEAIEAGGSDFHGARIYLYYPPIDDIVEVSEAEEVETYRIFNLPRDGSKSYLTFSIEAISKTYSISSETGFQLDVEAYKTYTIQSSTLLTLTTGICTISPRYENLLIDDTHVGMAEVGGTDTCADFISSLRSMYNLMFYTNSITNKVYIESRNNFYNNAESKVIDLRDKIDYSEPFELVELGEENGISLTLSYSQTNDVIDYYNYKLNTELGKQKITLLNKVTTDETEVSVEMFAPFITREVESMGMTLLQNARDTSEEEIGDVDFDITRTIGYFAGVEERTGVVTDAYTSYPRLIFRDYAKGINLGFEPLSDIEGLSKYYDSNVASYNYGRRLTMRIKLDPQDMESILYPRDDPHRDMRVPYLLEINGEEVQCLLEEVVDYNPNSSGSTECVFIIDQGSEE